MEPPNPLSQAVAGSAVPHARRKDSPSRPAAPMSAAKVAVVAAADRLFDEEVGFLRDLVRCPSTRGRTNDVQRRIAATLREMGLDVAELGIDREPIAGLPGFSPADWPYEGLIQVVGRLPAAAPGGRSLILNGHVDVVSAEPVDQWRRDPWGGEIAEGRMYGRGTCDMKGGVAAMIFAVRAVQRAGVGLCGDVLVETVLDEECGGNGTLSLLAQGYRADAAIIPEPSMLGFSTAQVGVLWCRVRVRGRASHAGTAAAAVNAIEKAYVVYRALKDLEQEVNRPEVRHPLYAGLEHPLNYNIGVIQGGDWPSSVPGEC
ncbi:MAG: M20/M25/M40 family metallo-hydrolase, partial [Chloroflexota bacterium]